MYCKAISEFIPRLRDMRPGSRIVITSRLDNLSRHLSAVKRLTKNIYEVQRLTTGPRIIAFVEQYISDESTRHAFMDALQTSPAAERMAQNAFLLTGMIFIYERDGSLPPSRALCCVVWRG